MTDQTPICEAKIPYETKAKAAAVAKRMGGKKLGLGAYCCPVCGFFHVGHERDAASKAYFRTVRRGLAA